MLLSTDSFGYLQMFKLRKLQRIRFAFIFFLNDVHIYVLGALRKIPIYILSKEKTNFRLCFEHFRWYPNFSWELAVNIYFIIR